MAGSRPATWPPSTKRAYLSITDRKKDLIKTSGGKFIAPQPIENSLKANLLVGEAALLGDKRKFPAVLIVPNFAELEEWAQHHGVEILLAQGAGEVALTCSRCMRASSRN